MKQLIIVVDSVRYTTEEWTIDLETGQDPDEIGKKIKEDPVSLYWDYAAHLTNSEDVDDEIQKVIEWRVREDDNCTA
jgi:hypothetical protein